MRRNRYKPGMQQRGALRMNPDIVPSRIKRDRYRQATLKPLVVSYFDFEQGKALDKVIIQSKSPASFCSSGLSVAAWLNIWIAWGDFMLSGMQNGFRRLVNSVPICSPCTMPIRYAAQAVCRPLPLGLAQSP
jgi:hypothetical protein